MRNYLYIFLLFAVILTILGCQTGSSSVPSSFSVLSTNIKISGEVRKMTGATTYTNLENSKISLTPSGKISYSDKSGKFFFNVPKDNYDLLVELKGYESKTITISAIDTSPVIILEKGTLSYSGTVADSDGQIINGATVEIVSISSELNTFTTKTDLNGIFSFTDLPEEDYSIHISATNYSLLSDTVNSTALGTTTDTYALSSSTKDEHKLSGTVYQVGTTTPISDATVEIQLTDGTLYQNQVKKTDSAGEYVFQSLPAGFYQVVIKKSNYLTYTKTIEIVNDTVVSNIYLTLTSGTQPTGEGTKEVVLYLSDADTQTPISGAIIEFQDTIYSGITDNLGYATFEVPVSTYNLEISKGGYVTQTRTLNLSVATTNPIEISLIYDLVSNLGNIKGIVERSDKETRTFSGNDYFTHEVIVTATVYTNGEIDQDITITTVANENDEYIYKNLQILYDPDGKEYKYILRAWYDFNEDTSIDTDEVSYQIVDLEAGKTSIADIMLITPY
ncbi:MAG: hypothetical protein C0601_01150 [Candidatus Muiribacterium halophilum]|uniref:PEGA domain-containing protein n=1 Tax=Muiribacterium halophilum TaxID=2053465 RepID=A0A2N5ZM11_MUIH1|nr:MAG: hypothetical protein C0601_01150 [Candidatus Muirbacterium halophilum]